MCFMIDDTFIYFLLGKANDLLFDNIEIFLYASHVTL